MSETTPASPSPELGSGEGDRPKPEPSSGEEEPPRADRAARMLPLLGVLAFLLLAGALVYLWQQQRTFVQPPGIDPARVTALEEQVRTLQQRLAELEQRPPPPPPPSPAQTPDLRPLEARIAALEQRPPPPPSPSPAPPPDLHPLEGRIAALEQRPAPAPAPDLGPLLGRMDALEHRVTQADTAATAAANRADRVLRIEAAALALAAGQPLGNLPDAPAALTRFATEKPPTEAELRLGFPAAARRATEASRPTTESQSMAERMWLQIESMVTVRSGDRVILGAPASVVLDAARERLGAGDLAGSVAALDALDGGAAQAMADWRARAQSLLDARAALASLARG